MSTRKNMNAVAVKSRVGVVQQLIVMAQAIRRNCTAEEAQEAATIESLLAVRAEELNLSLKQTDKKPAKKQNKRDRELAGLMGGKK